MIRYIDGAAPILDGGESEELFYRVHDVEEIVKRVEKDDDEAEQELALKVLNLIEKELQNNQDLDFSVAVSRSFKQIKHTGVSKMPSKRSLLRAFKKQPPLGVVARAWLAKNLVTKRVRSDSGVLVVTVLTSPYPYLVDENGTLTDDNTISEELRKKKGAFSCKFDCFYCPNEPGQPRSYLRDEPAVLRANQNGYDPVLQFTDRCATLLENGHHIDKIEILVLGGTWSSYPLDYRETFARDLFFAANTFLKPDMKRKRLALKEEQLINETSDCRIIGLTIETRPDCVNLEELRHLRRSKFTFDFVCKVTNDPY